LEYGDEDRFRLQEAMNRAKDYNRGLLLELDFIERFLLLQADRQLPVEERNQWIHFIMRFQQLTGPLMAKGFEDTALYIYNRLVSLNEVGGDPGRFGVPLETFHQFNAMRSRQWPHAMSATSTHDTKRGEDVRARINVLSELPKEWEKKISRWTRLNPKRSGGTGQEVPDRNDEYFLYQMLVGSFPLDGDAQDYRERLKNYMIKAVREAKVHTEWLKPDAAYEDAFVAFADEFLKTEPPSRFLSDFLPFVEKIAFYGMLNSLSQTVLKIAAPGAPDFYQGTEFWELSFVDPDNRRPVDFKKRIELLKDLKRREKDDRAALVQELLARWTDGRIKLYTIYKALNLRRTETELFQSGDYLPVHAAGKVKENVCAFLRRKDNASVLTAAPRLVTGLTGVGAPPLGERAWGGSVLMLPAEAPDRWRNIFTGEELRASSADGKKELRLADVLHNFPAAILTTGGRR
jgi:(1->4)-alpha-D-glucan 1-alpha-D-glucosylmutase